MCGAKGGCAGCVNLVCLLKLVLSSCTDYVLLSALQFGLLWRKRSCEDKLRACCDLWCAVCAVLCCAAPPRFNAVDTRCNMDLDDIRPESWTRLLSATTEYCSQPDVAAQFDRLAAMLQQGSPAAAGALAGEDVPIGGSRAAKAQPHVVGRHTGARLSKSGHAQQQQQHHLQQQTGQLLLASLSLRDLPDSSTDRPPSRHVSGDMHAAVQQALQQAAADTGPSSAPRLLYQHGLLLVQARRHVAGVAAAAAVARGADLTALQQQECVAELLAAALPADLVHTCDLSVASAAAAQGLAALAQEQHGTDAANHNHHHHHHHQQQHEQHPPLRSPSDVAIAAAAAEAAAAASKGVHSAGPGSLETSPRRMDSRHGNTTNSSSNNQHMQNGLAAAAAVNSSTLTRQEVAERRKAALLQRASDTGVGGSSMSPKSSSWLEYLFPWQQGGAASAGSSPRQQQQPPFLLDGSKAGRQQLGADSDAAALAGAPTAAAGGALGSGGAAGAGANVPDAGDSRSPGRLAAANGQGPPRRMMGDGTRPQGVCGGRGQVGWLLVRGRRRRRQGGVMLPACEVPPSLNLFCISSTNAWGVQYTHKCVRH